MDNYLKINDLYYLTEMRVSDKPALLLYMNDEVLYNNTLRIPSPYTEGDADAFLKICRQTEREYDQIINWAIRNANDELIGGIGRFMASEKTTKHKDEIGYWLAKPLRGQGIMTEIVKGYCDYLMRIYGLIRIEAIVFPHNLGSMKVLEKAGFEREGYGKKFQIKNGAPLDAVLYAKVTN